MNRITSTLVLSIVALFLAGCGGSSDLPELVPVRGTVKFNGQPLPNAFITFEPGEGKRASTGTTNEAGEYELTFSAENKGAIPGTHTVRISRGEGEAIVYPEGVDPDKLSEAQQAKYAAEAAQNIPAKYNRESELQVEVKADQDTYDFDLKTDEGV